MNLIHVCYALEMHLLLLYIQWRGLDARLKWGLGFLGVNFPFIKTCALFSSCDGAFICAACTKAIAHLQKYVAILLFL